MSTEGWRDRTRGDLRTTGEAASDKAVRRIEVGERSARGAELSAARARCALPFRSDVAGLLEGVLRALEGVLRLAAGLPMAPAVFSRPGPRS